MTRLRILSDLHFEHHADHGRSFIAELPPGDGDEVLCLVGDISMTEWLLETATALCAKFWRVVMVAGNHEYYSAGRFGVQKAMRKIVARNSNFTWLDKDVLTLPNGQRIVGCTLWFPLTAFAKRLEGHWSDFGHIPGFKNWVYEENDGCFSFLMRAMQPGDVVLTHYLPLWHSVHPDFAGRDTNCYYVSNCEALIAGRKPALWCHGHTHVSFDYTFESTRVVCNPLGYVPHIGAEPEKRLFNHRFDPAKIVEVP